MGVTVVAGGDVEATVEAEDETEELEVELIVELDTVELVDWLTVAKAVGALSMNDCVVTGLLQSATVLSGHVPQQYQISSEPEYTMSGTSKEAGHCQYEE